jgi:general L-amino acid transport system permease protein
MTTADTSSERSLLYRLFNDKELRSVTIQVITMALILAFFFFIINNAITNLETIGKGYSFGFLWDASNYDINQHLIEYNSQSPHWRAAVVGLINTLLVATYRCYSIFCWFTVSS